MKYRPEIDGLRAVAVLPVILFHAGFLIFEGGFVGVDVFFVISGFLITNIILKELNTNEFSLLEFYERRARRILPALTIVMITCIPFTLIWYMPGDMKNFSESLVSSSLFFSNILFWRESGYFETASELKPLVHTWSLAIEEQFYILFPLLLIILWKLRGNILFLVILICFFLSFFLAHWGAYNYPTASFWLLPTRGWELLLGAVISIYLFQNNFEPPKRVSQVFSLIGISFIIVSILFFDKNTPSPSIFHLAPTLGAGLIILFALPGTLLNKFLSNKLLVVVGLISYSLYLIHQPIFAITKYRFQADTIETYIIPILISIFFLAFLNWKFIEKPFRNRNIFSRNQIFKYSFTSIFVIASFGTFGVVSNGFEQRFSEYERKVLMQYTDPGKYVNSRFHNFDIDFDNSNETRNVLIIGDSFAEDLINAVFESKISNFVSISTKKIEAHCGNLFVNRNLSEYILPQKIKTCRNNFNDSIFLSRLKNADEIWLAASWREWTLSMIPESIENYKKFSPNANIKVFGRKNFGLRNANEFINSFKLGTEALLSTKPLEESHITINEFMKKIIDKEEFIDVSWLICNSKTQCSNKTLDGLPISYDGAHLTKAGAKYLGNKLAEKKYFQSLMAKL